MESEFLVGVVIVLTLWVFVILVAITPWFGVTIIPYMVIFTFIGAAIILGIIWAYKSESLEGLGWETLVIILLVMAAVLVGLFVLWFFIRKKLKTFDKKIKEVKVCDEIKEMKAERASHYEEIGSMNDGRPKGYRLPPPSKYSPQLGEPRGMVPVPSLYSESASPEGRERTMFQMSPPFSASMSPQNSASQTPQSTQASMSSQSPQSTQASMSAQPQASVQGRNYSPSEEGGCPMGGGFCKMNLGN